MSHVKCALLKRSQNIFNDYCSYQEHKTLLVQCFLQCFIQKHWEITMQFQRIHLQWDEVIRAQPSGNSKRKSNVYLYNIHTIRSVSLRRQL